jgi:hypothetical protein
VWGFSWLGQQRTGLTSDNQFERWRLVINCWGCQQ